MRRAASHSVWCFGKQHRLHYIEWDESNVLITLAPLEEELAGVAFFNGTLVVIPATEQLVANMPMEDWLRLSIKVLPGMPVEIYHLNEKGFQKILTTE